MHKKRIIGFDMDGTLANFEHRKEDFLYSPKDWSEINNKSLKDPPHDELLYLNRLLGEDEDNIVIIITARSEASRKHTERWLLNNDVIYKKIYMRDIGDYRPDYEVKLDLAKKVYEEYGEKLYLVFEDNPQVCDMWRKNNIKCLQVEETRLE